MPMNADLQRERSQATIDTLALTHMLDGGPQQTHRRRQIEGLVARDPTGVFARPEDNIYLHRTDRHVRSLAKHVRLIELARMLRLGEEPTTNNKQLPVMINSLYGDVLSSPDWPTLVAAVSDDLPTSLHWIMFVPNIVSLCDDEQQAEWLPLCRDWKMIGCYAQTELGHVSVYMRGCVFQ
jgi:acyl-CoA oxidase